ncbi:FAR1 DNA binding domain-containing protein [Tanacetum coccineum]|uniref:FAR1 DNA binding domain-containing protein n=1 Tax=Tanacetum coccineum TaxID=301880 RepID=A0ABQ5CTS7_9ASTR
MGESSMIRHHDMGESSMVRDHDMGESSMVRYDQVDNQIVVLPEHLQHPDDSHEFQPTPNGTPYWVPNVPEDENPKKGKLRRSNEVNTLNEVDGEDGENSASNKRKCHNETTKSFSQMLEAFLKMHKKQPPFAVTDQDGALRKAVVKMFPDSHHRLCDLAADTNFRKDFYKIVWNVYIGHDVFEQRWNDMISRYNLHDNKWMSGMYAIRGRWVPGYFKEVMFNKRDGSVTCSCGHYNRHGFLCRHVFCVFRIYGIHKIPDVYLNHRWTKNVLPAHLLDKRHIYGPCIKETDTLASQVHQTIEECIGFFRNDTDKLSELLLTVQDLKKKLENEMQTPYVELNKGGLYSDLLDVIVPDKVVIKTHKSIFRSKGTRRIKSAAEKGKAKTIARTNRKVPFKWRTCSACSGKGHKKATCEGCSTYGEPGHHKGICKKFPNQDKGGGSGKNVVVDDEDEGDTDDQFNDEALGATKD